MRNLSSISEEDLRKNLFIHYYSFFFFVCVYAQPDRKQVSAVPHPAVFAVVHRRGSKCKNEQVMTWPVHVCWSDASRRWHDPAAARKIYMFAARFIFIYTASDAGCSKIGCKWRQILISKIRREKVSSGEVCEWIRQQQNTDYCLENVSNSWSYAAFWAHMVASVCTWTFYFTSAQFQELDLGSSCAHYFSCGKIALQLIPAASNVVILEGKKGVFNNCARRNLHAQLQEVREGTCSFTQCLCSGFLSQYKHLNWSSGDSKGVRLEGVCVSCTSLPTCTGCIPAVRSLIAGIDFRTVPLIGG